MARSSISIISWNIRQGGDSRVDKILAALREEDPAILVLSEFRNNDNGLAIRTALLQRGYGWHVTTAAIGDSNSVLIASRFPSGSALFPDSDPTFGDSIARADLPVCRLYGVSMPKEKQHRLFDFLLDDELDDAVPSIISGDFNLGSSENHQKADSLCHIDKLESLEKRGYFDAFRLLHGEEKVYSWFSDQGNGYRPDQTYMHSALKPLLKECDYLHEWRETGLSDHSPMKIVLGF